MSEGNGVQTVTDPAKEIKPVKPSMLQNKLAAMVPKDITETIALAKIMSESTLVPKEFHKNVANCTLAIGLGGELGLSAFQAVQCIMVVNGRPTLWGDAMPGLIRASGKMEYLDETYEEKTKTAICRVKRVGEPEIVRMFSEADAATAGLTKKDGPWQNYRKRMLQMRARSWALRDGFADVLKGLQMFEEVRDYDVETTVVPNESAPKELETAIASSETLKPTGTPDVPATIAEPTPANPVVDVKAPDKAVWLNSEERKHIVSLMTEHNVRPEQLKKYLFDKFGITDDKKPTAFIKSENYAEVCRWLTDPQDDLGI